MNRDRIGFNCQDSAEKNFVCWFQSDRIRFERVDDVPPDPKRARVDNSPPTSIVCRAAGVAERVQVQAPSPI